MADSLSVDVTVVNKKLRALSAQFPAATDAALDRVGRIIHNMAIRQANRIYARPIPTQAQVAAYRSTGKPGKRVGGKGKKAWVRSGKLLSAITAGYVAETGIVTLSVGDDVPYALSRHQLGVGVSIVGGLKGWIPKNPALGIMRVNPFYTEAIAMTKPQIIPVFRQTLKDELKALQ